MRLSLQLMNNILIYGDSNVAGWSDESLRLRNQQDVWSYKIKDYVQENYKQYSVEIFGYPGGTYKDLQQDLQQKLNQFQPSIIILMILTNDIAQYDNIQPIIDLYQQLINQCRINKDTKILYIQYPGVIEQKLKYFAEFHNKQEMFDLFDQYIKQQKDIQIVNQLQKQNIGKDGVHLNKSGQKFLFEVMKEELSKIL